MKRRRSASFSSPSARARALACSRCSRSPICGAGAAADRARCCSGIALALVLVARGTRVVGAASRQAGERVARVLALSHVVAVARSGVRGAAVSRWRSLIGGLVVDRTTRGAASAAVACDRRRASAWAVLVLHGDDLREPEADPAVAHALDAGQLPAARPLVGRARCSLRWHRVYGAPARPCVVARGACSASRRSSAKLALLARDRSWRGPAR